jgi:hypothetical protein
MVTPSDKAVARKINKDVLVALARSLSGTHSSLAEELSVVSLELMNKSEILQTISGYVSRSLF